MSCCALRETRSPGSIAYRIGSVGILAAVPAFCVVLYLFDPARGGYPLCLFKLWTGLDCPGCGTLRALHQLLHGNLGRALDHNVLTVAALPLAAYAIASAVMILVRGRGLPQILRSPVTGWVLVGVIMGFWLIRNIPVYPLTVLRS